MHKNSKKYANKKSQMKGLAKITSEQFVQKLIRSIDLQILQNTPFYCQSS